MASSFKVSVKNGDSNYTYNSDTGQYDFKTIDYVQEYDNLGDALLGFLEWATDIDGLENKLTLTLTPEKKGKKGKK